MIGRQQGLDYIGGRTRSRDQHFADSVNRQQYDCAMHKMARSTVFISGMAGLGVEIGMERSLNVAFSCVYSTCV